jgi:hypothetical protein
MDSVAKVHTLPNGFISPRIYAELLGVTPAWRGADSRNRQVGQK